MNVKEIFDLITLNTRQVLPDLEGHAFQETDSLSELGANSVERSEIIMMTLEDLELAISLVETYGPSNIGELAEFLHEKIIT